MTTQTLPCGLGRGVVLAAVQQNGLACVDADVALPSGPVRRAGNGSAERSARFFPVRGKPAVVKPAKYARRAVRHSRQTRRDGATCAVPVEWIIGVRRVTLWRKRLLKPHPQHPVLLEVLMEAL